MIDIQHGKLITTSNFYDGNVVSESHQQEVSIFSSKETILKDVIDALSLISRGETTKLELELKVDEKKRIRIKKTWRVDA